MEGSLGRKILVTSALPYANGSIHLGHMVEYIQTDIWARFQRIIGNECYYICADDAHGTPIMLKAKEMGIAPDVLVSKMREEHLVDFNNFAIVFDNYGSTNSLANHGLTIEIYRRAKEKGHIVMRNISQAFDPIEKMFLPDRFVKGLPITAEKSRIFLNCDSLHWAELDSPLFSQPINVFTALMQRVDDKAIAAVISASKDHR